MRVSQFIEYTNGTRSEELDFDFSELFLSYTEEDMQFLKDSLEKNDFAGIYKKREENEPDNLNYLYLSYFAPSEINHVFENIKDCFLTIAK